MNHTDLIFVRYITLDCKRFNYWIWFRDLRSGRFSNTKKRKTLIKFVETFLGPLSERWQYEVSDNDYYVIKVTDEKDLIFLLLKFKSIK